LEQNSEEKPSEKPKRTRFLPTFRNRISSSFLSTAFSERIAPFDLIARRKKRRRDARKRTLSALGVRGVACQREMSAFQRSDGITPPSTYNACRLVIQNVNELVMFCSLESRRPLGGKNQECKRTLDTVFCLEHVNEPMAYYKCRSKDIKKKA
jgi:hypothetical protein